MATSLLNLADQFAVYLPPLLWASPLLPPLLQLASACTRLREADPVSHALALLAHCISAHEREDDYEALQQVAGWLASWLDLSRCSFRLLCKTQAAALGPRPSRPCAQRRPTCALAPGVVWWLSSQACFWAQRQGICTHLPCDCLSLQILLKAVPSN